MISLTRLLKILKIIKYGIICENKKYSNLKLLYDKNINEFVFIDHQENYFCLTDLDKFLIAKK